MLRYLKILNDITIYLSCDNIYIYMKSNLDHDMNSLYLISHHFMSIEHY
jgi:hypothetical protein